MGIRPLKGVTIEITDAGDTIRIQNESLTHGLRFRSIGFPQRLFRNPRLGRAGNVRTEHRCETGRLSDIRGCSGLQFIGNDIVDLTDPGAIGKSRDERFVARVFAKEEQQRIYESANPDKTLWMLWACKETAFKVAGKLDRQILWAPSRFNVQINGDASLGAVNGTVNWPHGNVSVEVRIEPCFIHCIGSSSNPWDLHVITKGIGQLSSNGNAPPDLSERVRALIKKSLACRTSKKKADIKIVRPSGPRGLLPPVVYIDESIASIDISISHDGMFVAYAYVLAGNLD